MLTFIFYGDLTQEEMFVYNEAEKTLCIKTSDEYDNIPTKTWLAYHYWYCYLAKNNTHLISFGDDCTLQNEMKFVNTSFADVHYGGVRIHTGNPPCTWWHFNKVPATSWQHRKRSPLPGNKKKHMWVHEGAGVVFSKELMGKMLSKFNMAEGPLTEDIVTAFFEYVKKTCWYNDLLLGHIASEFDVAPQTIPGFGVKGDAPPFSGSV